ncbi:MAG: tRNA adenosine(34) deaminase TadA [Clostridia bacterium]|nr:tRNA adenosine(34) deaminase TadA [Clostridia bacterium]
MSDEIYMKRALALADIAADADEVPVGALIVQGDRIIAEAYNTREGSKCATHHAEILAIEEACRTLGGWRLPNCKLYVTLEPCPMCTGAIINARIDEVIFGAYDPKAGCCGSMTDLPSLPFNHKVTVRGGVLQTECKDALSAYFRGKRKK